MGEYHDRGEATMVVYNLGDPEAWERAGREIECWGKARTTIHALDSDRILVEYHAGGAADLREPA